jgi:hypothetical protein
MSETALPRMLLTLVVVLSSPLWVSRAETIAPCVRHSATVSFDRAIIDMSSVSE